MLSAHLYIQRGCLAQFRSFIADIQKFFSTGLFSLAHPEDNDEVIDDVVIINDITVLSLFISLLIQSIILQLKRYFFINRFYT